MRMLIVFIGAVTTMAAQAAQIPDLTTPEEINYMVKAVYPSNRRSA